MRKGRMLLTGFLMGSLLLSGCSRNSALQVVVPKKEQDSVLLSQGDETSVQEQVQAPVRYLCDKDFTNFRLVANARVIVPDVEGIRMKKIRSRAFSTEDLQHFQNTFLKDSTLYELKQETYEEEGYDETEIEVPENSSVDRNAEQAKLQKKEVELTMGTGEERQDAFTEAQKEEKESSCEELYSGQTQMVEPEVPDGYEACKALFLDFIDGKKTFYFNGTEDFSTLEGLFHAAVEKETDWKEQLKIAGLSMVCEELSASIGDNLTLEKKELPELGGQKEFYGMAAEEDGLYSYNLQNHMDEGNPIAFRLDSAYGDVFSMQDEQKLVMGSDELLSRTRFHEYNLAEVDLQKQGKELMKALGLDQTELWEVQDEKVFWWNYLDETCQQSEAEPAKQFTYCRMVDGVPLIRLFDQPYCEIQEDGLMKWPEEEIRAVYGKDGLLSFSWMAPVEIEDWQDDDVFLLPFSEISQIFEEMLEGSLTIETGILAGELNISEVRLGYVRVISKELLQEDSNVTTENGQDVYTGVLVPAWSFIGTASEVVAEAYGVNGGTRISYMTINATDGSIIGN